MSDALTNEPRLLSKQIPAVTLRTDDGIAMPEPSTQDNGWKRILCNGYAGAGYKQFMGYQTFIDLAGYKQSELTFVVTGAEITNSAPPTGATEGFVILDIVSTMPYMTTRDGTTTDKTIEDNRPWFAGQLTPSPGFPDSIHDMEQIVLCRKSVYYHDSGWSQSDLQQLSGVSEYGQAAAVAADRLYITRIFMPVQKEGMVPSIQIPHCVYHITGMAVQEDDKAYIMRLRRDFEIAKAVDL